MNPIVGRFVGGAALAFAGLAAVYAFGVAEADEALAVFLLVLCALGLLALVRTVSAAAPPPRESLFDRALRPKRPERTRPEELTRLEVDLAFGVESAGQLHSRVVPLLRSVAAARLVSRHGVDPARRPEAARRLLGDEVWALVRPDREPPRDLLARGIPLRTIAAAVDALERL